MAKKSRNKKFVPKLPALKANVPATDPGHINPINTRTKLTQPKPGMVNQVRPRITPPQRSATP